MNIFKGENETLSASLILFLRDDDDDDAHDVMLNLWHKEWVKRESGSLETIS